MCGIAGLFHPTNPKPIDPARIVAMTDVQAHRGPDGSGVWTALGVGLGHRRLSIIDVGGSPQPMALPGEQVVITFNGEIYNFADLRAELRARGAVFRTQGDTEVLLHAWAAWGPDMLARLNGMFAFAIYDAGRQALFVARDRMGVKPLHYVELADGAVAFASELKGLLAHPMVRRSPDVAAIEDYMALGYVPDDACIVAGVKKLPAGHFLLIERGRGVPPRCAGGISISRTARAAAPAISRRNWSNACARGALAHGRRRAAGRVPVGRRRFVGGRRADGGGEPRAGADLYHRVRGSGI